MQVQSLNTGSQGLVSYDATGTLKPLNFSGNSGDVLNGNGTWVAGSSFSQWISNRNNLYYNTGYVGIGIQNPTSPLTVAGNIVSTGNMYAQNIAAAQGLSVGTVIVTSTGNIDTLRSTAGLQVNATTVNATTINTQKLNLTTLTADTVKAPIITTSRIRTMPGDSVVLIGDSTFAFQRNLMYTLSVSCSPHPPCIVSVTGIGIGTPNTLTGANNYTPSFAIGTGNNVSGNGFAFGRNNNVSNNGIAFGNQLSNSVQNTILFGNNGTALLIDQNNNVGISTTTPKEKLDVAGIDNGGINTVFHESYLGNLDSKIYVITGYTGNVNYNPLFQVGDVGIISANFNGAPPAIHSGIVLAPQTGYSSGMRIDYSGFVQFGGTPNDLWTYTANGQPQTTPNTNGGWSVPIIIPNGGAIRTATEGAQERWLGFGMVDGPLRNPSTTGWYWLSEDGTGNSSVGCYPMTLLLDNNGYATLTVSQKGWCDYVFTSGYKSMSIKEKESYYLANKRLPDIDPESVVKTKGLDICKNMRGMTKNIEENRLDITALYDVIQKQDEKIDEQQKMMDDLEEQLNRIESKMNGKTAKN